MSQRRIAVSDTVFAAAGLLAVISTFLPWWRFSVSATVDGRIESVGGTVDGWNAGSGSGGRSAAANQTITGPLVWIPMLLLLILGALALVRALAAPQLLPGKLFYRVGTAAGGLSGSLVIVRWITYFAVPAGGLPAAARASSGADLGTYAGLLCGLAAVVAGAWELQQPYGRGQPQSGGRPQGFAPQQPQYAQPQEPYSQPQVPQQPYGQPQYAQPPQPQYGQQAHAYPQQHPQYVQPQQAYGEPQVPQQSYGQPQYAQPPQPRYGQESQGCPQQLQYGQPQQPQQSQQQQPPPQQWQ